MPSHDLFGQRAHLDRQPGGSIHSNIASFMSWLRETGAFAGYLRDVGVKEGDRIVGFIPKIPEAIVAFLAASSIGAIWSVCNQDVAVPGVLARFKQLEPTVMIVSDGVRYGGRSHDRRNAIHCSHSDREREVPR